MSATQVDRSSRWIVRRFLRASVFFLADVQVTYCLNDKVNIDYYKVVDNGDAVEAHAVKTSLSSFPSPDDLFQTLMLFGFELFQIPDSDFVDGVLSDEVVRRDAPSEVVKGDLVHIMYGTANAGTIQWEYMRE